MRVCLLRWLVVISDCTGALVEKTILNVLETNGADTGFAYTTQLWVRGLDYAIYITPTRNRQRCHNVIMTVDLSAVSCWNSRKRARNIVHLHHISSSGRRTSEFEHANLNSRCVNGLRASKRKFELVKIFINQLADVTWKLCMCIQSVLYAPHNYGYVVYSS